MAQFRGTVQGVRGPASRLGSKASGLTVVARSWNGEVRVNLYHDRRDGLDRYQIVINPESGHKGGVVAEGVFGEEA
jgi:hypothetical protein